MKNKVVWIMGIVLVVGLILTAIAIETNVKSDTTRCALVANGECLKVQFTVDIKEAPEEEAKLQRHCKPLSVEESQGGLHLLTVNPNTATEKMCIYDYTPEY